MFPVVNVLITPARDCGHLIVIVFFNRVREAHGSDVGMLIEVYWLGELYQRKVIPHTLCFVLLVAPVLVEPEGLDRDPDGRGL